MVHKQPIPIRKTLEDSGGIFVTSWVVGTPCGGCVCKINDAFAIKTTLIANCYGKNEAYTIHIVYMHIYSIFHKTLPISGL